MITKIAFIGQPTRDLAESRRFYGEVLGLENSVNYADHWSEYQTPDGKTIKSLPIRCPTWRSRRMTSSPRSAG